MTQEEKILYSLEYYVGSYRMCSIIAIAAPSDLVVVYRFGCNGRAVRLRFHSVRPNRTIINSVSMAIRLHQDGYLRHNYVPTESVN